MAGAGHGRGVGVGDRGVRELMASPSPDPRANWLPPGCTFGRWVRPWSVSRCTLTAVEVADVAEYAYRRLTYTANHPDWIVGVTGPIDVHLRDQVVGAPTLDEAERRLRDHVSLRSGEDGKRARISGGSYGPDRDITNTDLGILAAYRDVEFAPSNEAGGWRPEIVRCELLRAGFVSWREIVAWARAEAGIADAPRPVHEIAAWPQAGYSQLEMFA